MEIKGLHHSSPIANRSILGKDNYPKADKASFGNFLKKAVNEVNQRHVEANQAADKIGSGKEIDIHNTMIAMEKADVSFQLMMQVRNKTLEAYQEIMRMQI